MQEGSTIGASRSRHGSVREFRRQGLILSTTAHGLFEFTLTSFSKDDEGKCDTEEIYVDGNELPKTKIILRIAMHQF